MQKDFPSSGTASHRPSVILLVLVVGIPGAGKSTFLSHLQEQVRQSLFSPASDALFPPRFQPHEKYRTMEEAAKASPPSHSPSCTSIPLQFLPIEIFSLDAILQRLATSAPNGPSGEGVDEEEEEKVGGRPSCFTPRLWKEANAQLFHAVQQRLRELLDLPLEARSSPLPSPLSFSWDAKEEGRRGAPWTVQLVMVEDNMPLRSMREKFWKLCQALERSLGSTQREKKSTSPSLLPPPLLLELRIDASLQTCIERNERRWLRQHEKKPFPSHPEKGVEEDRRRHGGRGTGTEGEGRGGWPLPEAILRKVADQFEYCHATQEVRGATIQGDSRPPRSVLEKQWRVGRSDPYSTTGPFPSCWVLYRCPSSGMAEALCGGYAWASTTSDWLVLRHFSSSVSSPPSFFVSPHPCVPGPPIRALDGDADGDGSVRNVHALLAPTKAEEDPSALASFFLSTVLSHPDTWKRFQAEWDRLTALREAKEDHLQRERVRGMQRQAAAARAHPSFLHARETTPCGNAHGATNQKNSTSSSSSSFGDGEEVEVDRSMASPKCNEPREVRREVSFSCAPSCPDLWHHVDQYLRHLIHEAVLHASTVGGLSPPAYPKASQKWVAKRKKKVLQDFKGAMQDERKRQEKAASFSHRRRSTATAATAHGCGGAEATWDNPISPPEVSHEWQSYAAPLTEETFLPWVEASFLLPFRRAIEEHFSSRTIVTREG